jgi:hypothetical protein
VCSRWMRPLDDVSLPIGAPVHQRSGVQAARLRDHGADAATAQTAPDRPRRVGLVGNDALGSRARAPRPGTADGDHGHEEASGWILVANPPRERPSAWAAPLFPCRMLVGAHDGAVDLIQGPVELAVGLGIRPEFREHGRPDAVPPPAVEAVAAVCQGSHSDGRSRHPEPVQLIQRLASTVRRRSWAGRTLRGRSDGSNTRRVSSLSSGRGISHQQANVERLTLLRTEPTCWLRARLRAVHFDL